MKPATASRRLLGLVMASHPFPLLAVVSLTALIGVVTAGSDLSHRDFALVIVAMLSSQLAIGWSNDYLDRETDAVHQPGKPIPSGLVDASWLPGLIAAACLVSLAAGLMLGGVPLLLLVIGTASGLAYNLGIKDTRFSWLPYVIGLGVLPPFVWAALDSFRDEFLALYAVATPLAIAVHLANTLPDVEADVAAGRTGIAARLDRRASFGLLGAALVASPVLLGFSVLVVHFDHPAMIAGGLVAYGLLITTAGACYAKSRPDLAFKSITIAGVVFAVAFLAGL
jgi:4-hydroxybenzoate polyprenyltransferase